MKKINVSYTFQVHKFIDIDIEELEKFKTNATHDTLEELIADYIGANQDQYLNIDNSDEVNEVLEYCEACSIIEEDEDGDVIEEDDDFDKDEILNKIQK